MQLTRIKRERAVDAVYMTLRQAILSSLIRPGERLNVHDLAEKLGVSLTPVRHAIQQLTSDGLVEVKPRSGTFVASLSEQDVSETFDIRCALEVLAAEKAVGRITAKEIASMRTVLKSLKKPVKTEEDRRDHEKGNSEFHRILIRSSGNGRLLQMYEELNASIRIARIHASSEDWIGRLGQEEAEHTAILEALESGSLAKLEKAIKNHILRAKDSLIEALREKAD